MWQTMAKECKQMTKYDRQWQKNVSKWLNVTDNGTWQEIMLTGESERVLSAIE